MLGQRGFRPYNPILQMRKILDVTLNEEDHTYSDSNKLRYNSVSEIISNYKEPFDPYKRMADGGTLIGNYVIKHGHDEQYWLDEWTGTKNDACKRGTAFHKLREDTHNRAHGIALQLRPNIHIVRDFNHETDRNPGLDYSKLPNGSYRELTLFNRRYMIAGQADNVIFEDGFVDIEDDKTNGRFDTVSFKPPRGSYKMMKRPLHHLMDCHKGHYTTQLSTYAWMLEQFGLKIRNLRVLHWLILPDDEEKIMRGEEVKIEPSLYNITYEKEAVEAMIKHYTQSIRKR